VIRTVLVGLDSSPRAPGVFQAAVEIAGRFRAKLRPFRAVSVPPEFPPLAFGSQADPLPGVLTKLALEDIVRLVGGTIAAELEPPIVWVGEPAPLLLKACEAFDVDLLVIGSHGYRGIDHILGTTAAHVVNLAACSVLVVHERSGHRPARTLEDPPKAAS
jgi:nucleotide-binding universal stress UspA family protein